VAAFARLAGAVLSRSSTHARRVSGALSPRLRLIDAAARQHGNLA
jgi:hypothetical protein